MQKLLPLLLPLFFLVSCASAGIHTPDTGTPLRVSLLTRGGAQRFELANSTHTDPVELYSTKRSKSSGMKVASDDVLSDVIGFLGNYEYATYEMKGSVAGFGLAVYSLAFEVESASGTTHWGITKQSGKEEIANMKACYEYFFNAWNEVEAFQTVDNSDGNFQFREQ